MECREQFATDQEKNTTEEPGRPLNMVGDTRVGPGGSM